MNILVHPVVIFALTGLPLVAVCLEPVSIQFEKTPVLVASRQDAIFTVQTVSDTSLIRWTNAVPTTLAMWANGQPVLISVPEYQGRISVTATQLKITNSQLRDSGNYTVSVEPSPATGLGVNTRSVQLKVFDAVEGVSVSLPTLPLEGGNVSLRCSWSMGTEVSVVWGKGGTALSSDTRITIRAGSLIINPARRDDAGEYTCTVSNSVSAQTAKASLSVYYGPDAPQLTKTSSECVGGGDATIGQTVRLTCTSTSLPPASFSWELNGQPVTAGQSGSGVLSLQIFSTNQSGSYVCTAKNDITGGTSKQQINVAIVGTCLSVGAVAGIVVACVVALIIIIIVIIVLLRQRNVDRRLKDAIGLQKTNQNDGPTVLPPQNANTAYRDLANGNHPDPTLHNSLPQNQQNFTTLPNINDRNRPGNFSPQLHNGHLNTNAFQHNFSAPPDNGHTNNNNSYPNNDLQTSRSFPHPGQQNPNILIQTGNSQPGALAPTVHVNLNTLPRTDQFNSAQPQTVHVNLNTYPQEPNQPNPAIQQHNDQRESALRLQNGNDNHQNLSQTGLLNSDPLNLGNQMQTVLNNPLTNRSQPNQHPSNHTNDNRRAAYMRSSTEEQTRRSNPTQANNLFIDPSLGTSTNPSQMPWDRLQATPAYPNRPDVNSESSGSTERRPRSPRPDARRGRSGPRPRETKAAGELTQAASVPQGRDLQRQTLNVVLNNSQMGPTVQRQAAQQITPRAQAQSQSQTAPRHAIPQTQTPRTQNPIHTGLPLGTTIPHPTEEHNQPRIHKSDPLTQAGVRPDHMQPTVPPSIPLTEEALRQHTIQIENPFANRIQQTQAALQKPVAQSRPSQPIQQLNQTAPEATNSTSSARASRVPVDAKGTHAAGTHPPACDQSAR
ncbi:bromodomain-containing protein DDB_G0280777 [Xyrauchen texanus]|uniref:bromodomain-containing protein DDB_G0280777 n=1 Tax=Xyrauchen texanus TaxID=154827 RepID=UPI0022422DEE|nr:bromodomain-containing protein DDB_G0280777 [Xyrauchen texanus]